MQDTLYRKENTEENDGRILQEFTGNRRADTGFILQSQKSFLQIPCLGDSFENSRLLGDIVHYAGDKHRCKSSASHYHIHRHESLCQPYLFFAHATRNQGRRLDIGIEKHRTARKKRRLHRIGNANKRIVLDNHRGDTYKTV